MNIYDIIGYVALGFGFVFFFDTFWYWLSLPQLLRGSSIVVLPFVSETALSWVVAVVLLIAGSKKKNVQTKL